MYVFNRCKNQTGITRLIYIVTIWLDFVLTENIVKERNTLKLEIDRQMYPTKLWNAERIINRDPAITLHLFQRFSTCGARPL